MSALLEVRGLTVNYGGVLANADIDLNVHEGQLIGLIGANGAGKTTFIDAITGFAPLTRGSIRFGGDDITSEPPEARARKGLIRTFQSLELFEDLPVEDNLLVACETQGWATLPADLLRASLDETVDQRVEWALGIVGAQHLRERLPEDLSHGQRKLVGVARALAGRPRLLLVDEPAAGLDAHESVELSQRLRGLLDEGIAILLIDHDMSLVLGVSDEIYVLDFGRVVAHGSPAEVRSNPTVIAAYLGQSAGPAATAAAAAWSQPEVSEP
jgi:branched-chain amino acid transport system ATP-binding protein